MGTGDAHYHRARSLLLLTLCSALLSLGRGGGGGGGGGGATPILGWNNCQLDCGPRFPTDALVRATARQQWPRKWPEECRLLCFVNSTGTRICQTFYLRESLGIRRDDVSRSSCGLPVLSEDGIERIRVERSYNC